MSETLKPNFLPILRVLNHKVDFILVGGVAAVVQGCAGYDLGEGTIIPVLDLETLIAVKEETAGEKDRAILAIPRRTLEESRRK